MIDIRKQLLVELSRFNSDYIAHEIGNDKERFAELMKLLLEEKDPIPPRAAWVAETIYSSHPELITPFIKKLVQALSGFTHPGSRRCVLKILSQCKIPEKLHGPLIDLCFE